MKKPEDGNGVIMMKKLTTRGLQALAGGPSRLRSGSSKGTPAQEAGPRARESEPMRAPVDSMTEVTIPREMAAKPIALATDDEIDQATSLLDQLPRAAALSVDDEGETLMVSNPMSSPRPAAGLAAASDDRVERTAVLQAPVVQAAVAPPITPVPPAPAGAPKHQMSVRTPPTLIHSQQAIPDEIRQLAIKSLEAQKQAANAAPSVGAVAITPKGAVTPVPQKPQPGAPALVKGDKVQIVVRDTKRRTAFGWTAMLLALGVFVGLSTVAVVHGDAKHAWQAAKGFAAQKRAEPAATPVAAVAPPVQAPAPEPVAAAPAPAPAPTPDPVAAPDTKVDTKVADNKPTDVKDDAKASPKPEPKPEVTKPDPAPKPQQKPSNAYASTRVAANDDKPAKKPEPMFVAAKPEPKPKPEPVAAKPKPEKDPVAVAKPDPKPAPAAAPKDDDVAKISQMAQQQLGAALP